MFVALLDTNVLRPSLQRDFLLSLAFEGMYRPVWSTEILAELEYEEVQKLIDRDGPGASDVAQRGAGLVATMRSAFSDAEVTGWEPLVGSYGLLDANDEHVLAAAVVGGAGALVTSNVKDFPADRVPPAIEVLRPAEFAAKTVALSPRAALRAVGELAARSGGHGRIYTIDEVLDALVSRYGMGEAVGHLR